MLLNSALISLFLSTPSARRATSRGQQARGVTKVFLSTPSARRATYHTFSILSRGFYFYPRPPRGGRPSTFTGIMGATLFLSTPSARRATWKQALMLWQRVFLSTPSARRATNHQQKPRNASTISIHALREEGDGDDHILGFHHDDFYPRPPRGGRPAGGHLIRTREEFLSTPSARRATGRFDPL